MDQIFDVGSVQTGALDRRLVQVVPVDLVAGSVQGDSPRALHHVDDHVLNVRPVQASALDATGAPVGPIHPLRIRGGGVEEERQPKRNGDAQPLRSAHIALLPNRSRALPDGLTNGQITVKCRTRARTQEGRRLRDSSEPLESLSTPKCTPDGAEGGADAVTRQSKGRSGASRATTVAGRSSAAA